MNLGREITQSRLSWVDYAKGIGICLVVYGHVTRGVINAGLVHRPEILLSIDGVIYGFHMPLFFFLAGLFFFDSIEKYGGVGFISGKVDALLYPYVVWSLLQGAIEVSMSSFTNNQTSWGDVFAFVWEPRAQFWFLYGLFFCSLAAVLVRGVFSTVAEFTIAAGCLLFGLLAFFYGAWGEDIAAIRYFAGYMIYFCFGILLGLWKRDWRKFALASLAILALVFVLAVVDFHESREAKSNALLFGFFGLASVVFVSRYLSHLGLPVLERLGKYSLAIYLMHVIVGSGISIVLQRFFGVENLAVHIIIGCLGGVFISYWVARELEFRKVNWIFSVPVNHGVQALMKRAHAAGRM